MATPESTDKTAESVAEHLKCAESTCDRETVFHHVEKVLQLEPNNMRALQLRCEHHRIRDNHEAAISDLTQMLALNPNDDYILQRRAYQLLKIGAPNEALKDAERAIEISPTNAMNYQTRGLVLESLRRLDEADADYERYLETLDFADESTESYLKRNPAVCVANVEYSSRTACFPCTIEGRSDAHGLAWALAESPLLLRLFQEDFAAKTELHELYRDEPELDEMIEWYWLPGCND